MKLSRPVVLIDGSMGRFREGRLEDYDGGSRRRRDCSAAPLALGPAEWIRPAAMWTVAGAHAADNACR
jgi:hypothetical protein